MIDPRPLDPPTYWDPDPDEILTTALLFDVITESESNELELWEIEQRLREHFEGY